MQACQDESRSLLQITQVTNCIQQTMSAASVHVDGGHGMSVTVPSVNHHTPILNSALMHPLTALCHNIH